MIYGYARVSTIQQDLASQIEQLKANGVEVIYKEKVSGKTLKDRPELLKILDNIKAGDTLIVTTLDRLARSLIEGASIVQELFNKGVRVHILNMGILEDTTLGNLMLNMILSVAEFERNIIIERTQQGREIARKNPNYREGRPQKFTKKQLDHAMQLLENHSFGQVVDLTGISISTLKRESRKRKELALSNQC